SSDLATRRLVCYSSFPTPSLKPAVFVTTKVVSINQFDDRPRDFPPNPLHGHQPNLSCAKWALPPSLLGKISSFPLHKGTPRRGANWQRTGVPIGDHKPRRTSTAIPL